jgi:hypothetical protein
MSAAIRTIVAGVSQPAEDDPTLLAAAGLARRTGATLHLVTAFTVLAAFSPPEDEAERMNEAQVPLAGVPG